jgi:hypothetical protein
MDHTPGGKASAYTAQMGRLILARLAAGETVKQVTADPRMPAYCTVYQWLKVDDDFRRDWHAMRDAKARRRLEDVAERAAAKAFWEPHKAKVDGRRWWRRGRPSSYTRKKGLAVCEKIAGGMSVSELVTRRGMPSSKVFYTWLRTQPEFRDSYVAACRYREWLLSEQALGVVEDATPQTLATARRDWKAIEGRIGRLTPKVYRVRPRTQW